MMEMTDRRKTRYPVSTDVFVHVISPHDMVGRILDISAGGLGFEYVRLWDENREDDMDPPSRLNVLSSGSPMLKDAR
jgi:hypothetical protein